MKHLTMKEWFSSVRKLGYISRRAFSDAWKGNEALLVRGAALAVITAVMPYSVYWFYSRVIGALSDPAKRDTAITYVVEAILVLVVIAILNVLASLTERQFWHRLQVRFNVLFFQKKGALGIDTLENPDFRDTVSRAQENLIWPIMQVAEGQFTNLGNFVRLGVSLSIVGAYDWRLCILVILALVPQFLIDVRHGATQWMIFGAETDVRRRYQELRRHFMSRNFLAELKLFQNVEFFTKRIGDILDGFRMTQEEAEKKRHLQSLGAVTLSMSLIGAVLVVIVLRVTHGSLPLSKFVFLWGSMQGLHTALSGAIRDIARQNEWALYSADNYAVMDATPEKAKHTGTIVCADRIPEIVFDKVTFQYPWDSHDRIILRDVSFKIRPGERTALVGINGAGKTTLIKLLCRIYNPTGGKITVDGVDLRDLDIESWRRQLAVLFQNYANYLTHVKEAIALGNTDRPLDERRVEEAAIAGGADSFVADLPQGYDTMIGKDFTGGIDLSGGQHQRMALARVFYRKGKVIILDEPTASLDAFAEAEIFEELEKRPRDASMILITHRFSTIRNVDHIVVLDRGTVLEEGNHAMLMKRNGLYAEMFLKQARGYGIEPVKKNEEE